MNIRHSSAYDKLAVEAGTRSGLEKPDAKAVAADASACQVRDSLWADYERQLRDKQTYTLETIGEWLVEQNSKTSKTGVHRDRRALLDRERITALAAGRARAVIEAATESGEHDLLRGGRLIAGQLLFNALSNLSSESLEGMTPSQILRMVDTLGLLSKAHAETDLIRARLDELKRKFDEAVDAAKANRPGGELTAEDLADAKEAIFGKVA